MRISNYSFGSITVAGCSYTSDVILLPDRIIPNWWRKSGHLLVPEDLEEVVAAAPARLVIGTGAAGGMRVPEATLEFLRQEGIEPTVLRTKVACERFNLLAAEGDVAAALHLTC